MTSFDPYIQITPTQTIADPYNPLIGKAAITAPKRTDDIGKALGNLAPALTKFAAALEAPMLEEQKAFAERIVAETEADDLAKQLAGSDKKLPPGYSVALLRFVNAGLGRRAGSELRDALNAAVDQFDDGTFEDRPADVAGPIADQFLETYKSVYASPDFQKSFGPLREQWVSEFTRVAFARRGKARVKGATELYKEELARDFQSFLSGDMSSVDLNNSIGELGARMHFSALPAHLPPGAAQNEVWAVFSDSLAALPQNTAEEIDDKIEFCEQFKTLDPKEGTLNIDIEARDADKNPLGISDERKTGYATVFRTNVNLTIANLREERHKVGLREGASGRTVGLNTAERVMAAPEVIGMIDNRDLADLSNAELKNLADTVVSRLEQDKQGGMPFATENEKQLAISMSYKELVTARDSMANADTMSPREQAKAIKLARELRSKWNLNLHDLTSPQLQQHRKAANAAFDFMPGKDLAQVMELRKDALDQIDKVIESRSDLTIPKRNFLDAFRQQFTSQARNVVNKYLEDNGIRLPVDARDKNKKLTPGGWPGQKGQDLEQEIADMTFRAVQGVRGEYNLKADTEPLGTAVAKMEGWATNRVGDITEDVKTATANLRWELSTWADKHAQVRRLGAGHDSDMATLTPDLATQAEKDLGEFSLDPPPDQSRAPALARAIKTQADLAAGGKWEEVGRIQQEVDKQRETAKDIGSGVGLDWTWDSGVPGIALSAIDQQHMEDVNGKRIYPGQNRGAVRWADFGMYITERGYIDKTPSGWDIGDSATPAELQAMQQHHRAARSVLPLQQFTKASTSRTYWYEASKGDYRTSGIGGFPKGLKLRAIDINVMAVPVYPAKFVNGASTGFVSYAVKQHKKFAVKWVEAQKLTDSPEASTRKLGYETLGVLLEEYHGGKHGPIGEMHGKLPDIMRADPVRSWQAQEAMFSATQKGYTR